MASTLITCANTAARPASPSAGDTVFQEDTKQIITYDGAAWVEYDSDSASGYDLDGTNIISSAPLFHFDTALINGTDATGNPSNAADFTGQWTSRINGKTTAAQGTAAAQPIYYTSGENSKPYLYFDGGDYLYLTDRAYLKGDLTFMIVGKGTGTRFGPLGSPGSDYASAATFGLGGGGPFSGRSTDYLMFYSDGAGSGYPGVSSFPAGKDFNTQTRNLIFKRASSAASLFFDGNNLGTSNPTTDTSDVDVRVGVLGKTAYAGLVGNIYEIIAFDSALSSANLNKWNAYVTTKYAAGTGAMESQTDF